MIKRVGIVGGGRMGCGIAQAVAAAGIPVILRELTPELAGKAKAGIMKSLKRAVGKDKLTEDQMSAMLDSISVTDDLAELAESDLVIEAIVEDLAAKKEIFDALSKTCSSTALLATNTSALGIGKLAKSCEGPERFVGMHFFNPAAVMKLVEIVRGASTSDETVEAARAFAESIGKTPVVVKDSPGFVVNRLLIPFINEAAYAAMENVAGREDIDRAMQLGAAHPMGPLALADMIGIDIVVNILETFRREFDDPKYDTCPLLAELVADGMLGRKAGMGFFNYE